MLTCGYEVFVNIPLCIISPLQYLQWHPLTSWTRSNIPVSALETLFNLVQFCFPNFVFLYLYSNLWTSHCPATAGVHHRTQLGWFWIAAVSTHRCLIEEISSLLISPSTHVYWASIVGTTMKHIGKQWCINSLSFPISEQNFQDDFHLEAKKT